MTGRRLERFADSLGLGAPQRLGEFLFACDLPETLSRRNLVARTRVVRQRGRGTVAEAGMLVAPPGAARPMMVTDKFIAQFRPHVSRAQVDSMNRVNGVRVLEANRLRAHHFLLEVTEKSAVDALTMSNRYHGSGLTEYAHPNWIHNLRFREYLPDDDYFPRQWHLRNAGQGVPCTETVPCPGGLPCPGPDLDCPGTGGTEDADIDATLAWEIVGRISPKPEITIAVIDGGYDLGHPDFKDVLWTNPDDGSYGYDYFDCDGCHGNGCNTCGDTDPGWESAPDRTRLDHDAHGTPVAGLVGAADNDVGVVGVCPVARLMLIRRGFDEEHLAQAFQFAHDHGAKVITCSWGMDGTDPETPALDSTIGNLVKPPDGSPGITVLFAMDYAGSAGCERDEAVDLADLPGVIAVSGSTNRDTRLAEAACGDHVDVLAPSGSGTLNIATTDVRGMYGYNKLHGTVSTDPCYVERESFADLDYTYCFSGTSAATPIAAGVAGMLLAVNSDLTPTDVRRLLQDTADRIEPSVAAYDAETGFSDPSGTPSTHGYGRVNAFEAVRVAAPVYAGGKGGVDLYLRDNVLDWGNTEQASSVTFEQARGYEPHWDSRDIKVDAGPTFQGDPSASTTPSVSFDALTDEEPVPTETNRVYVRVRNRGPVSAEKVTVKLYWAYMGTATPALPSDFWTGFEANTFSASEWTFIGERTLANLAYSGSTAAKEAREVSGTTTTTDAAAVFAFLDWVPPARDSTKPNHYSLLAIVDSPQDRVSPYARMLAGEPAVEEDSFVDALTASDNNVSLRNVGYEDSNIPGTDPRYTRTRMRFSMRNPTPVISTRYHTLYHDVSFSGVWGVWDHSDGFPGGTPPMDPGEIVPAYLVIGVPVGMPAEVKAFQYTIRWDEGFARREGPRSGLTIRFRPGG